MIVNPILLSADLGRESAKGLSRAGGTGVEESGVRRIVAMQAMVVVALEAE